MPMTFNPWNLLIKFLKEDSGAPLIECVLIISLIGVVGGLFFIAVNKNNLFY